MRRALLALVVLAPFAASAAKPAKKKKKADQVEIWPPPDPATTGAEPDKKPKSDDPPKGDAPKNDDGDKYKLDPELRDSDPPPKREKAAPSDEDSKAEDDKSDDDEDACADQFDDCKEDCTIAHTNDDSLHVKGKLPVQKCVARCQRKYDRCTEQREAGLPDKDKDE